MKINWQQLIILFAGNYSACSVDLVFVVDSSCFFGVDNYQYLLNFTASIVQRLTIGSTASRVGFVSYGIYGTDIFYLNTYSSTSQVVNAILTLPYNGDWSNQFSGITQTYSTSFQAANGDRTNVQNVAVVISGFPYNQGSSPTLAAHVAHSQNIKILSVGVSGASLNDVYNISSFPKVQNITFWNVPTFEMLYSYVEQLHNQICEPQVNFIATPGKLAVKLVYFINSNKNKKINLANGKIVSPKIRQKLQLSFTIFHLICPLVLIMKLFDNTIVSMLQYFKTY